MHRRSIHVHGQGHFNSSQMLVCYLSGFSIRFQKLSRAHGQVTYVLLTRSPLDSGKQAFLPLVRLACIRHAASVHPEPGSNSIVFILCSYIWRYISLLLLYLLSLNLELTSVLVFSLLFVRYLFVMVLRTLFVKCFFNLLHSRVFVKGFLQSFLLFYIFFYKKSAKRRFFH